MQIMTGPRVPKNKYQIKLSKVSDGWSDGKKNTRNAYN